MEYYVIRPREARTALRDAPHLVLAFFSRHQPRPIPIHTDRTSNEMRGKSADTERKLISVLIPVFNEEGNIRRAYDAVRDVFEQMKDRYTFEIIFTDNHSTDNSSAIVSELAAADPRVRAVRFARNFGFQRSVLTAYRLASGDAAIQIDCDLQDPPTVFPRFLDLWEQGHDVVVGIRRFRQESKLLQWARRVYYRLLKRLSDDNLMLDSGDFRLIDRSVLDQLHLINDVAPYTRGLTSLLATKQIGVAYDRQARQSRG
ncbi:glycosyltransferase involved in cell wall biosynthesis [Bradyrhizobium sp. LM4.3]